MDRAIGTATAANPRVRGVDYRVNPLLRDVALNRCNLQHAPSMRLATDTNAGLARSVCSGFVPELMKAFPCDLQLFRGEQLRELRVDDDRLYGQVKPFTFPEFSEAVRDGG